MIRVCCAAIAERRFQWVIAILLAIFAGSLTADAHAQTSQDASPTGGHCSLHVWPSETTHATYFGWVHGGMVDGNRRGVKGYPEPYVDAIDMAAQASLLAQVDWPKQTGDPNVQITVHPIATGGDNDRKRVEPLIADQGDCYQELIITSSIVEFNVLSSRSVRIFGLRKKFTGVGNAPANYSAMTMAQIAMPEKPGPDFDDKMRLAVRNAYLEAVKKFITMQSLH